MVPFYVRIQNKEGYQKRSDVHNEDIAYFVIYFFPTETDFK